MKYHLIFLCLISTVISHFTFGQSADEIENTLKGHLKKMIYYKYDSPSGDSVMIENELFKKLFIKYISENPATLTAKMSELGKEGLMTANSDDGLFRIYSWDTQTGGTMRFYDNVYQYKSGGKVYFKLPEPDTAGIGDPRSWYSQIYTMDDGGKKYYLGLYNADYSTRDKAQGIKFFNIESSTLNTDVKLAKITGVLSNEIGVGYDFFSVPDNDERPLKVVVFDKSKLTITVPVIEGDSKVTNKHIVYKFKNGYFQEVK